jgi:pentatricopeptide repeat protein
MCAYTNSTTDKKTNMPTTVYSMMISTYLELGNYNHAHELINTLEASNTIIDSSVYETFITVLGFASVQEKKEAINDAVEEVMKMVAHMKERGLEPNITVYKQLINNLINQNKTDKALELLESLCKTKKDLSVDLFSPLVHAYCSNESPTKALKIVDLMKEAGVAPNEYLITTLIFCLVRTKQFNIAWNIVSWAKSAGLDIIGFGDIIQNSQKKLVSQNKI